MCATGCTTGCRPAHRQRGCRRSISWRCDPSQRESLASFRSIRRSREEFRLWRAGGLVGCILLSFLEYICCPNDPNMVCRAAGSRNSIRFRINGLSIKVEREPVPGQQTIQNNLLPRRVDFVNDIFGIVVAGTLCQYRIFGR
jgi:hypothetical protein